MSYERRTWRRAPFAIGLLVAMQALPAAAQDTHYWTNQYGPTSMLLSGAVIGSVRDMSATYYNPGALGYIADPAVLVSANAYQIESLKIKDGGGAGVDLSESRFNLLPNMLAGAFKKSWLGRNRLAYSFLTRHRVDAEVRGGRTSQIDVLPDPGTEQFAGAVRASRDAKELWAGVTWARPVRDKVGVGITTYLSIRSEGSVTEIFAQALSDSGNMALLFDVDNFSASMYSLLWKAGLGIDLDPLTLGLTVTTPNVQVIGTGRAGFNVSGVNIDMDGDMTPENGFVTSLQEDVDATYKSPLSIGAGVGYAFARTKLNVAAEWFAAIDAYDVLDLSPFISQSTGQTVVPTLRDAKESVVNVAAGVEHEFNDTYRGFLSFNTDNSAYSPESEVAVTGYDIAHVTAGGSVLLGRTRLMLGISLAWGSETIQQVVDLDPDDAANIDDPANQVELSYTRTTLLLGFHVEL